MVGSSLTSTSTSTADNSALSKSELSCMMEIVSYPVLLQHEESITKEGTNHIYDVSAWMLYLAEIDVLIEAFMDKIKRIRTEFHSNNHTNNSNSSSNNNKYRGDLSKAVIDDIGGRRNISVHEVTTLHHALLKTRNFISERALSVLPGSYKLWRDYLTFRSNTYILQSKSHILNHTNSSSDSSSSSIVVNPYYLLIASPHANTYKATISAYERSLIRMNKYPRIWLSYLFFTIQHDPSCSITNIRRLFQNCLLALPATQHDLVWSEYLTFLLQKLPPKALLYSNGSGTSMKGGNVNLGPLVQYYQKHHSITLPGCPTFSHTNHTTTTTSSDDDNHNNNDNDDDPITNNTVSILPPETILRILRHYAQYYNPTARELLLHIALQYNRYGEAAETLVDILNDVDFVSMDGTTRHELWMKLADICTNHPLEVRETTAMNMVGGGGGGVDFELIVRAVLKPPVHSTTTTNNNNSHTSTNTSHHVLGFEIYDYTEPQDDNNTNPQNDSNNNIERKQKAQEQRLQLQASLGEMEGTLWTKLAHYHIQNGEFELARSVYEEALESVSRVRDFSLIFDAYMKFEEGVIEAMMELMNEEEDDDEEEEEEEDKDEGVETADTKTKNNHQKEQEDDEDFNILLGKTTYKAKSNNHHNNDSDDEEEEHTSADVELALARAENLMNRRPLLLNRVLLRQNPHNVGEWLKRSDLYIKHHHQQQQTTPIQAIASLEEAVKSVDARKSMNGSPATLYITLAGLYENNMKNPTEARSVYERICRPMPEYSFRDVDDLAQCFASYVEMELRLENWDGALSIARRSVSHLPSSNSTKISRGLMKSLRLWNLLLDLEESLGTIQTTKDAYNRALEIKVATPSHVINFASYLADKKYFEESFTAYERGVDLFPFPHAGAKILWKEYLSSFYKRYGGTKIFRMRELFDRCLESCPPSDASEFFILYGKFEEEYGLAKRALGVYERMCTVVPPEEKFSAYELFITKTIKYGGITATRPIYERAIAALEDHPASIMCCAYAKMESSLNEIDRARAAFTYGAQLADPRRNPEYWGDWHEFEVSHGNEDTFREMLRVKRGVQAAFSTVNYNAAEMGAGVPKVETLTDDQALEMIAAREGVDAYEKERISGFVQGKRTKEMKDMDEVERRAAKLRKITAGNMAVAMPSEEKKPSIQGDEIDIGSSDEDDEGDEGVQQANVTNHTIIKDVNTKAIPAAVFGGLASQL